jgi:hypothetical protein
VRKIVFLFFILLAGYLAAQNNNLNEIKLDKERGFPIISNLNIGGIDAERFNQPLEVVMDSGALLAYPFVGSVGGVSFVSVAEFKVKPGQLFEYIAGNENGKRLMIAIDGKEYFPIVYDWQLIPISKYAQHTERLRAQNKVREHNVIMDKLNKLEPEVNAVLSFTNKIRNKTGLLRGYNPLVSLLRVV